MRVALVHEMLVKLGGAERVLKKLTQMFPSAPIYTLIHDPKATREWFGDRKIQTSCLQPYFKWLPHAKYLLPWMSRAVEAWDFSDYDLVISSSSAFAHGIQTGEKTKHICYCHSPMRYAWDYTHEYTRGYSKTGQWAIAKILHPIRQWDLRSASRPEVLLTNSNHVAKRIQKYWRRSASVIYPPVNVKRFTPRASHEDFFLIVSALTPFKKIELAIHTFNKIRRRLVIVGEGTERRRLESIANDNIEFLGRKSDEAVRDYMEHCRAFIFPGEEDFGITPVEAMAAGKPVLAYGAGGVTESVQAGVSGEFFDAPTAESLQIGLARLLANEPRYDSEKIRQIAERFDEGVFEEKMREITSF